MRIYGLIGYPLSHSFSKKFFADKFFNEGVKDCVYENFAIPSIDEFEHLVNTTHLKGLNVTIPYKQQVIRYLYEANEVVKKTGACNCIKIENGKLLGFNTDTIGFEESLKKFLKPYHKRALILGTGGAAKAIMYVLEKLQIEYITITRNSNGVVYPLIDYNGLTDELIRSHTLIINTTPLGMYPQINVAPAINYEMITPSHYLFDVVYNPEKTLFLKRGEDKGASIQNGFDMLIIQAEESWKIWNND